MTPIVTQTGAVSLSIDGVGSNAPAVVQVNKPAGATVLNAYLACATEWANRFLPDNVITLDGVGITWDTRVTTANVVNGWADVTALVRNKIDTAPAGLVNFTVGEGFSPNSYDGEILIVIFNDPNVPT